MHEAYDKLRLLRPGDEAALDSFLRGHAASSMFLRSNLRAAGIEDHAEVQQATYVGLFRGTELIAVAAHCWNGSLLLQAPVAVERVAAAAAEASGREVRALLGPASQVDAVQRSPLLRGRVPKKKSIEELMQLPLDRLIVPAALRDGRAQCRRCAESDRDLLASWRIAYEQETFGRTATAAIVRGARAEVERLSASAALFVLQTGHERVAMCAFNARLPDAVQLGGVFTLPAARGRGYGRSVTAGALLAARAEGVAAAVLFTGVDNAPALRAYRSLGFERVGDYALALFES
jgi:ribosomal protein S18 acetylase RimI-like enzyme